MQVQKMFAFLFRCAAPFLFSDIDLCIMQYIRAELLFSESYVYQQRYRVRFGCQFKQCDCMCIDKTKFSNLLNRPKFLGQLPCILIIFETKNFPLNVASCHYKKKVLELNVMEAFSFSTNDCTAVVNGQFFCLNNALQLESSLI